MTTPSDPHREQPTLQHGAKLAGAEGALILLHGRGASAEDILGLARELSHPGLVYLAPQAAGHTWYPSSFLVPTAQNQPWLSSALARVKATIDMALAAGIPLRKIALCGFSQGACLATEFVARNPAQYGGLIALTGGLIGSDHEVDAISNETGSLSGTPVFFGSGDPDPHVPWARVERSAAILKYLGADVTTQRYPGRPHTVTQDELDRADQIVSAMLSS